MKKIYLVMFMALVVCCGADLMANGLSDKIDLPRNSGFFDSLVNIYNQLIDVTKDTISQNMSKVVKVASKILMTMATFWIIITSIRNVVSGGQILTDFFNKMALMVILLALLQYKYYDHFVVHNLEILFNNLPTLFTSGDGNNVITNTINQTSKIANDIWDIAENKTWISSMFAYIMGGIAVFSLCILTGVVIINVLFATVKFYIVLSMSSILIICYFFQFTRNFTIGGVKVVLGAIINITLLSIFLSLFGKIIQHSLHFDKQSSFFGSCVSVIILSFVGYKLVDVIKEIAITMTAEMIAGGGKTGSLIANVGRVASVGKEAGKIAKAKIMGK